MSLFSESVVLFSQAKQSRVDALSTNSLSSPFANKVVKGVLKGPIDANGTKAVLDENGAVIELPENAIPTLLVLSGQASFVGASLKIFLAEKNLTKGVDVFNIVLKEWVNSGCYVPSGLVIKNTNFVCNVLAANMDSNPLPAEDVINVTVTYMEVV
jgi:hypothetical protein